MSTRFLQSSPLPASSARYGSPPPAAEGAACRVGGLRRRHRVEAAAALLIVIAGLALRLIPFFGVPDGRSEDEVLYTTNVAMLEKVGPYQYPALIQSYIHSQSRMRDVILPPTRCMYIMLGWAWDTVFHPGPRMSLRHVAAVFSVLGFLLAGLFAYRLGGARHGLVTGALMAVAPVELMLAHRELVDGVFAFWALLALWLLWENLQRPGRLGWLAVYAGALAAMVLTKENAFFAAVGIGGILATVALAPGLKLGKPAWSTVAATFAGGALGVAVLVCLAGSPRALVETYRLLVTKAEKTDFAYQTGGGPWFRYIIDLMLMSPTVLLPAIGGIFALRRENRQGIFLLLFILFSCAVMVNVRNGMNLRYATMWDMPLRYLAAGMILQLADSVRRAPVAAVMLMVAVIAGTELQHYWLYFIRHDIGEPVTQYLMWATEIVRTGTQP